MMRVFTMFFSHGSARVSRAVLCVPQRTRVTPDICPLQCEESRWKLRSLAGRQLMHAGRVRSPMPRAWLSLVICLTASSVLAQGTPPSVPLPHPEIAKPFVTEPGMPLWMLIAGGLVVLALLGMLVWLLFRKQSATEEPPLSAIKSALEKLQNLKPQLDQTTPAEISHRVSTILREYQEKRYAVPAPYRTSEELYHADTGLREQVRERFSPLAALYDRLSFAPQPATREDAAKLIDSALSALSEEKVYAAPVMPPPLPLTA